MAKIDFLRLCAAVLACDGVSPKTKADWNALRTKIVGFDIGDIFGR